MKTFYEYGIDDAWRVYYMDNDRQKIIVQSFKSYQAAVKYAQERKSDYGVSLEIEPIE